MSGKPAPTAPGAGMSEADYKRLHLKLLSRIAEGIEGIQVVLEAIHAELVQKTDDELDDVNKSEEDDNDGLEEILGK